MSHSIRPLHEVDLGDRRPDTDIKRSSMMVAFLATLAAWMLFDGDLETAETAARAAAAVPTPPVLAFSRACAAQIKLLKDFLHPYMQQGSCPSLRLLAPRLVERCSMEGGHTGECVWYGNNDLLGPLSKGTVRPICVRYRVDMTQEPEIQPVLVLAENDAEIQIVTRDENGRIHLPRISKAENYADDGGSAVSFLWLTDAVAHVKQQYDAQHKEAQGEYARATTHLLKVIAMSKDFDLAFAG